MPAAALLIATAALFDAAALRAEPARHAAALAIIIDDLGYRYPEGKAAIDLAGPVSYAILPHTPHARRLADYAATRGKPLLVHLPMEAAHGNHRLGPGALWSGMARTAFLAVLAKNLAAVPGAVAVNNHMGSELTTRREEMAWLFEGLHEHGVPLFVDSRTTHLTVAADVARCHGIDVLERDVFLDNDPSAAAVAGQFEEAVSRALTHGRAIAIGHPHPETIAVLGALLPSLASRGVTLVGLPELAVRDAAADAGGRAD